MSLSPPGGPTTPGPCAIAPPSSYASRPPLTLPIATAEDTVEHKLFWYRKAGQQSDKQWRDLQGVLRTLGKSLDRDRLELACADLEVADLLPGAWADAASSAGP